MSTYFEMILAKCAERNTTVLGVKGCEVVWLNGPLRLANKNAEALGALAMTALAGEASKEIRKGAVPAVPANFTISMTASRRYVGLIIRVSGSKNSFKQGDVLLTVSGTGMSTIKFAIAPLSNHCEAAVLLTNDNGGVGQIAAPTAISVLWEVADHPEAAGLEYVVEAESVSLRDFTSRT